MPKLNILISIITSVYLMSLTTQSAPTTEMALNTLDVMTTTMPSHTRELESSTSEAILSKSLAVDQSITTTQSAVKFESTSAATMTTTTTPQPTSSSSSSSTTATITETVQPLSVTTVGSTSSAPATDAFKEDKTTLPMSNGESQSNNSNILQKSNFSCYGKNLGYYADIQEDCKVYHFCLLGEYSGQSVYQRISYKCLNNSFFDQQALDCVEQAKLTAPCGESYLFYETSNVVLRQAVVGTNSLQNVSNTAANTNNDITQTPAAISQ